MTDNNTTTTTTSPFRSPEIASSPSSSPTTTETTTDAGRLPTTNTTSASAPSSSAAREDVWGTPDDTRLVTILAHVDHGKTSLADQLIASNGLISERLAGTLRYLDADPEEQRRGITMQASAIALQHTLSIQPQQQQLLLLPAAPPSKNHNKKTNNNLQAKKKMIVHLVDSPGHADFGREVSMALLACDTALLVVDAVEGMGTRTQQILREAQAHQLVPLLVLNKLDRYQTELHLDPIEAYKKCRTLIETVNASAAAMLASAHAEPSTTLPTTTTTTSSSDGAASSSHTHFQPGDCLIHEQQQEEDDEQRQRRKQQEEEWWTFDPAKGNVIFGSALYGWGFTVPALARALFRSQVVPIKPVQLKQILFADVCVVPNPSSSSTPPVKVIKWKPKASSYDESSGATMPLFAEWALKPLWDIYHAVHQAAPSTGSSSSSSWWSAEAPVLHQIWSVGQGGAATPGPGSPAWPNSVADLHTWLMRTGSVSSPDALLRTVLRRYRPLAGAVLDTVCQLGPSPAKAAQTIRSRTLALQPPLPMDRSIHTSWPGESTQNGDSWEAIRDAVRTCSSDPDAPCVAHVCKFMAVERAHLRDTASTTAAAGSGEHHVLLGLTRVLSGRLRTGQDYYLFGPKQTRQYHQHPDPSDPSSETDPDLAVPRRTIRVYLMMGSSLMAVDEVPAGHLCAVYNLEGIPFKTVTLCDRPSGTPLRGFEQMVRPLVKVNVEPEDAADTDDLEQGLVKLSLADSAVEVTATAKGERILACLGELHLEKSILDLQTIYCERPIKLRISDPIVEFAETTVWFPQHETVDHVAFWDDPAPPLRQATIPPYNEEEGLSYAHRGRTRSVVSGRCAAISLRIVPLAPSIYQALQDGEMNSEADEEELLKLARALGWSSTQSTNAIVQRLNDMLVHLGTNGNALIESPLLHLGHTVKGVLARSGEIYTSSRDDGAGIDPSARQAFAAVRELIRDMCAHDGITRSDADAAAWNIWTNDMKGSAVAGFQLAMRSGPICEEPIRSILVVLEGVEIAVSSPQADSSSNSWQAAKPLSGGMVVAALRSGIRSALLTRPTRLAEGYLRLTLHSSLSTLGALYSVLSRRRGRVLDDTMVDGTDLLLITALVPQAEAFGLAPELLGKTSGEVTAPEMVFSHWDLLDVDPFWIPTTLEEREDFGELKMSGDTSTGIDNTALKYIRAVRQRKGLVVDSSRTVIAAEKQRTLKK